VPDLSSATVGDLLIHYKGILAELTRRRLVRTKNAPVGDLADKCAAEVYRGTLEPTAHAAFALTAQDGRRVQVRCRHWSETYPLSRRFSTIASLEFDVCLFLLVDGDNVLQASEWLPEDIREKGQWLKGPQAWSVTVGQLQKHSYVGRDHTYDFQAAWQRLLHSTAYDLDADAPDLLDLQIRWAHRYHGYHRLARDPQDLQRLLQPAWDEYHRIGTVPQWCGIDLLKGWAFHLVRADYHTGGGTLDRQFQEVLGAISRHPAVGLGDMPPGFRSAAARRRP
jgi:hypothetical protein